VKTRNTIPIRCRFFPDLFEDLYLTADHRRPISTARWKIYQNADFGALIDQNFHGLKIIFLRMSELQIPAHMLAKDALRNRRSLQFPRRPAPPPFNVFRYESNPSHRQTYQNLTLFFCFEPIFNRG
jgi:hypothetical protein